MRRAWGRSNNHSWSLGTRVSRTTENDVLPDDSEAIGAAAAPGSTKAAAAVPREVYPPTQYSQTAAASQSTPKQTSPSSGNRIHASPTRSRSEGAGDVDNLRLRRALRSHNPRRRLPHQLSPGSRRPPAPWTLLKAASYCWLLAPPPLHLRVPLHIPSAPRRIPCALVRNLHLHTAQLHQRLRPHGVVDVDYAHVRTRVRVSLGRLLLWATGSRTTTIKHVRHGANSGVSTPIRHDCGRGGVYVG